MLPFAKPTVYETQKCYVTYGKMGHIHPRQLPSKGKPWTILAGQDFVYEVNLLIPCESYQAIRQMLVEGSTPPEYARVTMPLLEILHGPFFTEYIKRGNVQMRSKARPGIDIMIALRDGVLTMHLDKESYERAGLVGQPLGVKGKRGLKPRWIVQYNLRAPAAFPGKKGYDRLLYAAKNVLNEPIDWLFCNLQASQPDPDPLMPHGPQIFSARPDVVEELDVAMPDLKPPAEILSTEGRAAFDDFAADTYEWLSLLRLQSPRIGAGDIIDPYLSRYQVPGEADRQTEAKLCKISWQGFLSPTWTKKTLIDTVLALPSRSWFGFSATTFSQGMTGQAGECMVLRPPGSPDEYVAWEIRDHD